MALNVATKQIPTYSPRTFVKKSARTENTPLRILLFASENPVRGFELALDAVGKFIKNADLQVALIIKHEKPKSNNSFLPLFDLFLPMEKVERIEIISDWIDEARLTALFVNADFAVLPYDPKQFAFQPSGNLIHALRNSCIPIVSRGTWMEEELDTFGLNFLSANRNPDDFYRVLSASFLKMNAIKDLLDNQQNFLSQHYGREKLVNFIIKSMG